MKQKMFFLSIFLALALVLASCSGPLLGKAAQPENTDLSKLPLESKLGIGILALEGTDQAVSAQQAKDLLPLWKAVKVMTPAATTSPDEIKALYRQIEESLTPAQLDAIKNLTLTQESMRALMAKDGIRPGASGQGQGGFANLSPEERATRVAQFQSQRSGGTGRTGGEFPGSGFAPGGFPNGGGTDGRLPNQQRTPAANQPMPAARRAITTGGLNYPFADAVINLLKKKVGK